MDSPVGNLLLEADEQGITLVQFVQKSAVVTTTSNSLLNQCKQELNEYFFEKRMFFTVPLSLRGTDFQLRVWEQLQAIPYGTTTSYAKIAEQLGDPKVIRAAASANGKNPVAIIVPCHRVIGAQGDLTGYAGGLDKKEWLLKHEGAIHQNQLSFFNN